MFSTSDMSFSNQKNISRFFFYFHTSTTNLFLAFIKIVVIFAASITSAPLTYWFDWLANLISQKILIDKV